MALGAVAGACEGVRWDTGRHREVVASECVTCHQAEYQATSHPPHVDVFPDTCVTCHSQDSWTPTSFTHEWPLEGPHADAPCTSCHVGDPPVYQGTPKECVGCHRDDYDTSPYPGHDLFPTTCESCHTVAGWKPATVNHSWPLDGVHASTPCTSCHVGDPPVYQGTPQECVGCHRDDYDTSPFPGHSTFPTACESCHTTPAWKPATFTHAWPLTGAHTNAPCTSCHVGDPPVYQGTPQECVGCHRDDYDTSPYPGHGAFSTLCQTCHTTTAWTPASAAHPDAQFPLTGVHSGIECGQCHNAALGPNGKDNADCVGCHTGEHTRARMDDKHREVSGYPAGAAAPNFCLTCHADGRNDN